MGDSSLPRVLALSPAVAGFKICCAFIPGAYAPGFMLPPASLADYFRQLRWMISIVR